MNNKIKQLVPICIIIAIALFGAIVWLTCKDSFTSYDEAKNNAKQALNKQENLSSQVRSIEDVQESEKLKLKSLKPIYEATNNIEGENNLSVFGNMFDEIITKIRANGLMMYSIEYNMLPESDPIYTTSPGYYNVCELKFVLAGYYSQLQGFINDINNNFPNLVYISGLNVTAFESNTDYLLINLAITLYSKKPIQSKRQPLGNK